MTTSRRLTFILRLGSSIVLWAVALTIIFTGYAVGFAFLISALALLSLWEYYRMLAHKGYSCHSLTGLICAALFLGGSFYQFSTVGPAQSYEWELFILLIFMITVLTRQIFQPLRKESPPLETIAFTLFGLLYVVWLFNFVTKIVYVVPRGPENQIMGHFYVLYLVVITKFSDMGAYLTGSVIGKHLLVPHISPKKTWEGFAGSLAFALLGSLGLMKLMPDKLPGLDFTHAVVLGLGLGFAAVVGDLAESLIKRSTGAKDSGSMLPGIGGALDLIDSLLFTAPLLYFYLQWVILK